MSERAVKNSFSNSSEHHSANLVSLDEHRNRSRKNSAAVAKSNPVPSQVTFHRTELNAILRVYGFKVADGEWRDYAIDHLRERAVFSIFRRASEMPIYRVEKNPKLSRKQGQYSILTATGQILKRGNDLAQVLKILEKKPRLVTY